jgi:8-oxo-dGTP pyrophosphatase MutT (NUDIX family)
MTPDDVRARFSAQRNVPPPPRGCARSSCPTVFRSSGGPADARPAAARARLPGTGREAHWSSPSASSTARTITREVSLPGGKADPGDADAVATALREAEEEVGLDPDAAGVEIVGRLDALWIPPSNFLVTPIVAIAARRPAFVPDPREVAAILEAPVAAFLPDVAPVIIDPDPRGRPLRYGAYIVEGRIVWGATAAILGQLGAVLDR